MYSPPSPTSLTHTRMAQGPRLECLPSFDHSLVEVTTATHGSQDSCDSGDDGSDFEFEFSFSPGLTEPAGGFSAAPADEVFSNGLILPAYPVFDRHVLSGSEKVPASTAPPSPEPADLSCEWAPRSAPGSPPRAFPKSASTGEALRWRLRDLVAGRSQSDGREKFVFLEKTPTRTPAPAVPATKLEGKKKQQTKGGKKAVTEMDMATAHRLFYGGKGGAAAGGKKQSYLPYRPGIVGFFANVNALGRSHHPY